jgi:cell wall-associated NlpC family hydrolase
MEYSDLLGTPFVWGGRSPQAGLDCWGLVVEVYRRLGCAVADVDDYSALQAENVSPQIVDACAATWRRVEEPYEPYDVLLFSEGSCGAVTHCGLYIGHGLMLHTTRATGVIVTSLRNVNRRFAGAWRRAEVPCPA